MTGSVTYDDGLLLPMPPVLMFGRGPSDVVNSSIRMVEKPYSVYSSFQNDTPKFIITSPI